METNKGWLCEGRALVRLHQHIHKHKHTQTHTYTYISDPWLSNVEHVFFFLFSFFFLFLLPFFSFFFLQKTGVKFSLDLSFYSKQRISSYGRDWS